VREVYWHADETTALKFLLDLLYLEGHESSDQCLTSLLNHFARAGSKHTALIAYAVLRRAMSRLSAASSEQLVLVTCARQKFRH
jgi:hypothetical protein